MSIATNTEQKLADSLDIKFQLKNIRINNHNIRYLVAGHGDPLLLIHGANFGWGMWYPNIPALAKYFTVYAIDLPGAGRSSRVDYATLDIQKDIFKTVEIFLETLAVPRIHILGSSLGGWLALKLALSRQQQVSKIVVQNTVGFADYMKWSDKIIGFYPLAKFISKTVLKPTRQNKNIEHFLRGIFYDKALNLRQEFIEYFYETMSMSHNLLFISRMTALTKQLLLQKKLQEINAQLLIIWGEQDKIMPLQRNENNFTLVPNAQKEIFSHTGHIPSLEKPERFNNSVLNFLQQPYKH